MGILSIILVGIYVVVCIFLVLVVLLQQGKGADLAGAFGGGGSQTSFGPRSSTNYMHRATTISFVLFVLLSVTLAVRSGLERGQSVVAGVENEQPAQEQAVVAEPEDEGGTAGAGETAAVPVEAPPAETGAPAVGDEAAATGDQADGQAGPAVEVEDADPGDNTDGDDQS